MLKDIKPQTSFRLIDCSKQRVLTSCLLFDYAFQPFRQIGGGKVLILYSLCQVDWLDLFRFWFENSVSDRSQFRLILHVIYILYFIYFLERWSPDVEATWFVMGTTSEHFEKYWHDTLFVPGSCNQEWSENVDCNCFPKSYWDIPLSISPYFSFMNLFSHRLIDSSTSVWHLIQYWF